jgi:hypothetical protein
MSLTRSLSIDNFRSASGTMFTHDTHQIRRSKRTVARARASVVVDLASHPQRIPCLILDQSCGGFRVRLSGRLRRGQSLEVIPHDDPLHAVLCTVVWVGKPGSKQEGEVGLQT